MENIATNNFLFCSLAFFSFISTSLECECEDEGRQGCLSSFPISTASASVSAFIPSILSLSSGSQLFLRSREENQVTATYGQTDRHRHRHRHTASHTANRIFLAKTEGCLPNMKSSAEIDEEKREHEKKKKHVQISGDSTHNSFPPLQFFNYSRPVQDEFSFILPSSVCSNVPCSSVVQLVILYSIF